MVRINTCVRRFDREVILKRNLRSYFERYLFRNSVSNNGSD